MSVQLANQKKFQGDLKKMAEIMMISVEETTAKVAFDIFRGVNEKTPVDTGYARASWNISSRKPKIATASRSKHKGKHSIPTGKMSGGGFQKLAQVANDVSTRWFISNNVPYIVALEGGHSDQQSHMVERTLNKVQTDASDLILKGIT